jgi:hypothetical protein
MRKLFGRRRSKTDGVEALGAQQQQRRLDAQSDDLRSVRSLAYLKARQLGSVTSKTASR